MEERPGEQSREGASQTIPLRLQGRRDFAPGLAALTFDGWSAAFRSGQYCSLVHNIGGERVERHYSIASRPGDPLELYIVCVEGGALTPTLFAMAPGDGLHCVGAPRGKFTLEKVPAGRDLWLVGTGTGLAPFLSMLRAGTPAQRFERVVLVHTVRKGEELGYRDELEAMQAASEGRLRYVPTTSRDEVPGALRGRVTEALDDGRLEAAAGCTLGAHSQIMLCGNPAMLDDMKARLSGRGLELHRPHRPANVHLEKYW